MLADLRPTALLARRAPTAVLADCRPTALLALRALTAVLADFRPTALRGDDSTRVPNPHADPALLRQLLSFLLRVLDFTILVEGHSHVRPPDRRLHIRPTAALLAHGEQTTMLADLRPTALHPPNYDTSGYQSSVFIPN